MQFREYQHVERFGMPEVEQINFGRCFVFPKIDGTNVSAWLGDDGKIHAGGRHRELTLENDNAGFLSYIRKHEGVNRFLKAFPRFRLYGEWLVPHSLETYREECWKRFYVFDVVFENTWGNLTYLPYPEYKEILDDYGIDYIPVLAIIDCPTEGQLVSYLDKNVYLVKDGHGFGEGIVIKNYDFLSRNGKVVWAKMVRSEFKEIHARKMMDTRKALAGQMSVERKIVDKYVTQALCQKERAKLENATGKGMKSIIPMLLYNVYDCLLREDTHHFVMEFGNPTIDFKLVRYLCERKVKDSCGDLFEAKQKGK